MCVCVCVCVYVEGRKEIKRERVREGEESSVSSSPFSLPVSLLPVTPSFLPSPDHPSALLRARVSPPTTPTTPGPFDSPHFSVPTARTSQQVRLLRLWKSTSCPLLSSSNSSALAVFFTLTCLCCLWLFCLASMHILKFSLQHVCASQRSDTVAGDDISEVTVFFFFLCFSALKSTSSSLSTPQSLHLSSSCLWQSHSPQLIACANWKVSRGLLFLCLPRAQVVKYNVLYCGYGFWKCLHYLVTAIYTC